MPPVCRFSNMWFCCFFLLWNLSFSMIVLPKINNKIFDVLRGCGRAEWVVQKSKSADTKYEQLKLHIHNKTWRSRILNFPDEDTLRSTWKQVCLWVNIEDHHTVNGGLIQTATLAMRLSSRLCSRMPSGSVCQWINIIPLLCPNSLLSSWWLPITLSVAPSWPIPIRRQPKPPSSHPCTHPLLTPSRI